MLHLCSTTRRRATHNNFRFLPDCDSCSMYSDPTIEIQRKERVAVKQTVISSLGSSAESAIASLAVFKYTVWSPYGVHKPLKNSENSSPKTTRNRIRPIEPSTVPMIPVMRPAFLLASSGFAFRAWQMAIGPTMTRQARGPKSGPSATA